MSLAPPFPGLLQAKSARGCSGPQTAKRRSKEKRRKREEAKHEKKEAASRKCGMIMMGRCV